jgi:CubicO group peptidase (beta-lactamase class C family)
LTASGRCSRWVLGGVCLLLSASFAGGARSNTAVSATGSTADSVSGDVITAFPEDSAPGAPSPLAIPERAAGASSGEATPGPGTSRAESIEIPAIDALLAKAIRGGRTPGAVVIAGGRNGVEFRRAYGRRAILPEREAMTSDTIFDLASLTKPLVVGTLVQWLIENQRLRLADHAVQYLPEFAVRDKQLVTIEQLLLHTSGLPPSNSLNDFKHGPEKARALTLGGWLYKYSGREFIYSDIGYIALGELIENITGERLDQTAERVIWRPLGMRDTRYCPTLCEDPRIAPTELNYGWAKNPIRGEPSDTRVFRLGGVAGNAGLFSSADDLARYARMLLNGGELDQQRVLSQHAVHEMLLSRAVPKARRALGWDVSSGFSSGRGHLLSDQAVGHSGYTGTSIWIDPVKDLFIIFLSNRNHPFSTGKVTDLQGQIADFVVRALRPAPEAEAALAPESTNRPSRGAQLGEPLPLGSKESLPESGG